MAHPQGTQGPPRVGSGPPLKEIANLYGNITSAPTPSTKDYVHKETISPVLAQFAQVLAEHLQGTIAAQTPGNIPNTVPETPDSAIISPGLTSQTHESSLVMAPVTASSSTDRNTTTEIKNMVQRFLGVSTLPGGTISNLGNLLTAKNKSEFVSRLENSSHGYTIKSGQTNFFVNLDHLQNPAKIDSVTNVIIQFVTHLFHREYKQSTWINELQLPGFHIGRNGLYDGILEEHLLRLLQCVDKTVTSCIRQELENNQDKNKKIDDNLLSALSGLLDDTFIKAIGETGATAEAIDLICNALFTIPEADLTKMREDYVQRATFACTLESLNFVLVADLHKEYLALKGQYADNEKTVTAFELPNPIDILSAVSGRTVSERLIPIQDKLITFLGTISTTSVTQSRMLKTAQAAQAELSTWRTVNKFPEKKRPPAAGDSVLNLTNQGAEKDTKHLTKEQEQEAKERAAIHLACKKTGYCMKYNFNRKSGLDHDAATTTCAEVRRKNGKGDCPFNHCLIDIVRRKISPTSDDPGLQKCQPASTADGSTSP